MSEKKVYTRTVDTMTGVTVVDTIAFYVRGTEVGDMRVTTEVFHNEDAPVYRFVTKPGKAEIMQKFGEDWPEVRYSLRHEGFILASL